MALPKQLYANLALVPDAPAPVKKGPVAVERPRIDAEREAEAHLKRKIDQACRALDKLEARERIFAAYIKELQKRKAFTCAKLARIEDAIIERMQQAGLNNIAGVRSAMRTQPAAEALEVIDETLIPAEYMRSPKAPPKQPDKIAIKKALALAEDLNPADWGCRLTSKISLIRT